MMGLALASLLGRRRGHLLHHAHDAGADRPVSRRRRDRAGQPGVRPAHGRRPDARSPALRRALRRARALDLRRSAAVGLLGEVPRDRCRLPHRVAVVCVAGRGRAGGRLPDAVLDEHALDPGVLAHAGPRAECHPSHSARHGRRRRAPRRVHARHRARRRSRSRAWRETAPVRCTPVARAEERRRERGSPDGGRAVARRGVRRRSRGRVAGGGTDRPGAAQGEPAGDRRRPGGRADGMGGGALRLSGVAHAGVDVPARRRRSTHALRALPGRARRGGAGRRDQGAVRAADPSMEGQEISR